VALNQRDHSLKSIDLGPAPDPPLHRTRVREHVFTHYTDAGPRPAGTVMTVEFELDGQRFVGINGGPEFTFDEAVSFQISCADQDEVDYFWERLCESGEEGQCGWLKDKFGLSWQVVPTEVEQLFADPDPQRSQRAMQALFGMRKIDVAALRSAADGAPST